MNMPHMECLGMSKLGQKSRSRTEPTSPGITNLDSVYLQNLDLVNLVSYPKVWLDDARCMMYGI